MTIENFQCSEIPHTSSIQYLMDTFYNFFFPLCSRTLLRHGWVEPPQICEKKVTISTRTAKISQSFLRDTYDNLVSACGNKRLVGLSPALQAISFPSRICSVSYPKDAEKCFLSCARERKIHSLLICVPRNRQRSLVFVSLAQRLSTRNAFIKGRAYNGPSFFYIFE